VERLRHESVELGVAAIRAADASLLRLLAAADAGCEAPRILVDLGNPAALPVTRRRASCFALVLIFQVLNSCMIVRMDLILTKIPDQPGVVPAGRKQSPGRW
jgi:hypothetical protein